MDNTQYLLVCLAEECAEVVQECSKAIRFGLDDDYREETPRERIAQELEDMFGVYSLLGGSSVLRQMDTNRVKAKMEKVMNFMIDEESKEEDV